MSTYSPFVGSRPFDTADQAIFHGRADETAALTELWKGHRLTVLHGPAGVGKTSLLRAGALPGLGPSGDVLPVGTLAFLADFPLAVLPDLNPLTFALLSSWYPDESPTRILGSSIADLLRRNRPVDRYGAPIPVLAAVDQTDVLFPEFGERDGHRRRFAHELVEAVATQSDLHLLLAIRTENLEGLQALLTEAGLPAGSLAWFPLHAFDPVTAWQAVRGPLSGTDHPLATSAEQLVAELGTGGTDIDPALLQVVCRRLWDELPPGSRTEIDDLPKKVDQILSDHCLRSLAAVATDHGEWPSVMTGWYRHVFGHRSGSAGVPEGDGVTRDLPNTVVRALEDVHLLQVDRKSGRRRYRLRQPRLRSVVRRLDPEAAASARHERPRLDAAESAFTSGDVELARRHAMAVVEQTEGRPRAAAECLLGTLAYDQGRMESAIEHYEAAIRAFGALRDTARVGMLLAAVGRLKIGNGSPDAVNELHAALTRLPGDPFIKTALAQALWYAGRTQAAIALLDDTLSQDGGTPEALRLRGELLADLDKAEPALRDLDRVNYGDRPSSLAAWTLAQMMFRGADQAATDELDIVDDADDSGPVLLRVARVMRLEGDADTAAGLAERAVRARRPPLPRHLHGQAERLMAR
jgi:tetratricopeptide (TPR) repeat protein